MWIIVFPVTAFVALIFGILTICEIKKENSKNEISKIKIRIFICTCSLNVFLFLLGLFKVDVRFNPSSNDSIYSIDFNDTISLASDFSFGQISPIYYTVNGIHVDDTDEPIKYTGKIYVQNFNMENPVTIHAELRLFETPLFFGSSTYTYNIVNEPDSKHHIVIEQKEVTLDELKKNNYLVDLTVRLHKNAGITYDEWGLSTRKNCLLKMTYPWDHNLDPNNGNTSFLWLTKMQERTEFSNSENILSFQIKLPPNAAVGDFYPVNYEDESPNGKLHIWRNTTTDWAANGDVTWTNGGVHIIE